MPKYVQRLDLRSPGFTVTSKTYELIINSLCILYVFRLATNKINTLFSLNNPWHCQCLE